MLNSKNDEGFQTTALLLTLFVVISVFTALVLGITKYKEQLTSLFLKKTSLSQPINNFPQIPTMPNLVLVDSSQEGSGDSLKTKTTWSTDAPVSEVSKWYTEQLTTAGWTLDLPSDNPEAEDLQYFAFIRGETRLNVSLIRGNNDDKTTVVIEVPPPTTEDEE